MKTVQPAGCVLVQTTESHQTRQGLSCFTGILAESVGSRGICMHLVTIPPGGRATAHMHESHETTIYTLAGESEVLYGENLGERLIARAGDFLYIPAGVSHLPINRDPTEPCIVVVARTDPNAEEGVVLLPELDGLVDL